ncbi:MAG: ATP synthase F0 subunit B [Cyanobacteria bacterium HKST-UBA04]|nr:ATP synthase F0 subunit B [Cyanobacteria bacterium HKST-UBA04]MCA9841754.1 ATP synthase F0 subunit B [Cyanobacteria bacterium HKST-UBA03]
MLPYSLIAKFTPVLLLANAGAHEAAAAHTAHQMGLWDMVVHSNVINVALVALLLGWLMAKFQVPGLVDKQRQAVAKSLKDAEAKRDKALVKLEELERRLAKLDGEVAQIISDAEQTASEVAQGIVAQAERDAEKMLAQAQKRAELEQRQAALDIEYRLLIEAVGETRDYLNASLSDQDRQKSVETFLDQLPELVANAKGGQN